MRRKNLSQKKYVSFCIFKAKCPHLSPPQKLMVQVPSNIYLYQQVSLKFVHIWKGVVFTVLLAIHVVEVALHKCIITITMVLRISIKGMFFLMFAPLMVRICGVLPANITYISLGSVPHINTTCGFFSIQKLCCVYLYHKRPIKPTLWFTGI